MDITQAVDDIGPRFRYKDDKSGDYWFVMPENSDGFLYGDCDDFAVTAIWKCCDSNILKFIINVMILHRYRLYHCWAEGKSNQGHMCGYAQGKWFDNWGKKAMDKEAFLARNGHVVRYFYPLPLMILPLIVGLFRRKESTKEE